MNGAELLIKAGTNVNHVNKQNMTAIQVAVYDGNI